MLSTFVSVGATTLFVLGLILVASWVARRRLDLQGTARPQGPDLRVIRRVGIGPRQGVALLQVGERRLLVSCGDGGVRVLAHLDEDEGDQGSAPEREEGNAGEDPFHGTGTGPDRAWVRRLLPTAGIVLALGVGLGAPAAAWAAPTATTLAAPDAVALALEAPAALQQQQPPADRPGLPAMEFRLGGDGDDGGLQVTGPVGAVLLIGFLTLIPTLLLLMTSFTRILIVLHLLKQALGAQAAPPAHVITALALLLTGFVMAPTLQQVNEEALTPWMDGEMDEVEMLSTASVPFREFMLTATRDEDLVFFMDLRGEEIPEDLAEISLVALTSAFVTSELRTAFQMGFAIFLPFLVIDLVVASVLMSMGMFMLPPLMVSLPFKLLLFVLVDGWGLVVGNLVQSFQ
ncbi:MAG: flagellar biosynthetic protein FliP [Gemmatimonadales bacterium]|nr:MAG: flagellar biosynthetic protein FliP [Gemmatimonadales bacterium]